MWTTPYDLQRWWSLSDKEPHELHIISVKEISSEKPSVMKIAEDEFFLA